MERERFCNICESPNELFGTGLVLNKYNVKFFRCSQCGFIQTEKPYWLEEAYATPIVSSDLGYVGRNVGMSKITRSVLSVGFDRNGEFVDYGGGYGMFVRLMGDAGFDYYRYDLHCENLFAHGLDLAESENSRIEKKFDLLTAFEVFEHLADPLSEVRKM